ncbi:nucleotidyltransferase domain-containing protein [Candidatus Saganbacteria bacterium]|nr:nucleotidyltransferase domain-containing protein [Candidatus Saganbacteria bacterium]
MDQEHQRIKEKIIEIIKKNIKADHYKIFFFGSRASGNATAKSDIDIGIEAKKKLSAAEKLDVQADLESIRTLNKFDFVDFKTVSDDFKDVALQHFEVIYEQ